MGEALSSNQSGEDPMQTSNTDFIVCPPPCLARESRSHDGKVWDITAYMQHSGCAEHAT